MSVGAVTDIAARIAEIQARFPTPEPGGGWPAAPGARVGSAAGSGAAAPAVLPGTFADALDQATRVPPSGGTADPAAEAVLQTAHRYLGVPYLWGGTNPDIGLDCSGFVQLVFRQHGIDLPRVSRDQARAGTAVASLAEARPGDLVAFGHPVDHIGIYMGDNKMIVAPHTGAHVRVQEITRPISHIRRVLPG